MTADGQDGHDEAASRPPDAAARPRAPGMADAAGRMALFPARVAARRWRHQLEGAAEEVLATPEIERLVDRALAGPLPEAVVRSLARRAAVGRADDAACSHDRRHERRGWGDGPAGDGRSRGGGVRGRPGID